MHCPKCQYQSDSLNSLRIHAAKQHSLSSEDLYLAVVADGKRPVCKCGCGQHTKFNTLQRGYSDFVLGHASRVNNNWGHNEAAREKSLKKRRDEGLWSRNPWNRGLTKETDERLTRAGETMSRKNGERYSRLMSEKRNNGIIPSLRGPDHPKWKGGTSALGAMCHADNRLYAQWKLPKLQAAGFRCSRCDSSADLHVHHDSVRMAEIIHRYRDALPGEELTHDQKLWLVDQVVDHHLREQVSGTVLCEKCHELEHASLNFSSAP